MMRSIFGRRSLSRVGGIPAWGLLALLVAGPWGPAPANAQDRGIGRGAAERTDSMAIAPVEIDASVEASAVADGRAESLARFRSALAASLTADLAGMRKFTIVAREDLDPVSYTHLTLPTTPYV